MSIVFDGGGSALSTGTKADLTLPYRLTITGWQVMGLATGSIIIDLYKSTGSMGISAFPPTSSGKMSIGGTGPFINTGISNSGTNSGWLYPTGAYGDIIRVNITSNTAITLASLALTYYKY
jgi:hypothetical protein